MHVTIIDGDLCYPMTSGKRLRTLNLMLPLARQHRLTYIARGLGTVEDQEAAVFLAGHGITPVIVADPLAPKSGAAFYARLAANLTSPLPYSVASHVSPAMRAAVEHHWANAQVDLWQLEWMGYNYCINGLRRPVVVQAHNVDQLLWRRYFEAERNIVKRLYIADQTRKLSRFECRVFRAMTRIIVVSAADAEVARKLYGNLPLDVVDNGVDVAAFRHIHPLSDSRTILFLGALDWRPNADAIELLLNRIFPLVRTRAGDTKLAIVGRNPPAWLQERVVGEPGVELHADVPRVEPYLERSAVLAVPLRIGGGTRLKILEALAAGLPVVSSGVGAEGLMLTPGVDFTLADSPEAMAAALLRCLRDRAWARAQGEHGRATVAARYDWNMLSVRLERVWEAAVRETRSML
jgi:glycosyltransferase involved in cell wall biosynthesis